MSRVAKAPVILPKGVSVTLNGRQVEVKDSKSTMSLHLHDLVELNQEDGIVTVSPVSETREAWMHAGTVRSLLNNLVIGITEGFEKKLQLIGVGYKAQVAGNKITLNVGYSHPIEYILPEGVFAETPTQTEIILKSSDKQKLGQAASKIRGYRPPGAYPVQGKQISKGIRYSDEYVHLKEAKKK